MFILTTPLTTLLPAHPYSLKLKQTLKSSTILGRVRRAR